MTDPDAGRFQQPCAADEEIAAVIGGMMAAGERRRMVAHLASCESCYAVYAGAARLTIAAASQCGAGTHGRRGGSTAARRTAGSALSGAAGAGSSGIRHFR
jgi:hypothetical protein